MDTIFAQASAPGRAGVAVIRISGPQAFAIAQEISGKRPEGRESVLRNLRGTGGEVIDQALLLSFPGPNSFTGEDVVEFQLHGSIAVVRAMLSLLSTFPETRMAEAGEFTRRALENEKLDLAQVEGLADLIEAETEAQRKQALRVLSGHLGARVEDWRKDLIRAAALLEATIDFADEEVPVDVTPEVEALLSKVGKELQAEAEGTYVAERVRNGFEVAIIGAPNAGKSTLLNALAGRDAAITSEIAGTTRDVIEVRMDLDGLPVTLLDTAGLRESEDKVEAIGIERAIERAEAADLRVFLAAPGEALVLTPAEEDIVLQPKADLVGIEENGISGKTGQGVSELIQRIQSTLSERSSNIGLATHERHRVALQQAVSCLAEVNVILTRGPDFYDLAAADLRFGIRTLETLVGRIDVENLLDEIFTSFCVGK
ncbi:tRNA uridine-5-carboxymethylaminomethyl(34) synthesis GTPase MnmE [Sulfitobacter sp. KE34]|uniref:tRNA uridine-5-carboxymethylaminomethyl(34) synthesis GTPase MnmE n=1 Tax=unclassified Sulfitobacter TaxID=196795 RepID=UPI0023E1FA86|nr:MULTISPECIES: tRNA uridine-5-carboxymethylaminomethyl(34) synthesis GTPase MnmE [unclassified Sulfitobacter]MDF3349887.1 tRNA uridine-5-carboxymethylaminomethyl(34) synthesis GTPase MnmE [Sulfitobacter sp. KE12]MDF3353559.1 tRNA uridine-5-carboxymethylaminomethyl(34) synthesis GTPase MnmE [Sulfitobacter sp. KE27]MDF3357206.1 tRNA uridine-5-carboxymethylaminomethyl(34) synthesis GTPase MnmE [Sulfitobacter sp. KE33]MDF3364630.1 tRNA uridine-5-carboxymethylaminomethyl(34) synthesis GTPase MnmE 